MVYNNFFLRLLITFIFLSIYLSISFINFSLVFYLIFLIYLIVLIEIIIYFKNYKYYPIIYLAISFVFFLIIDFEDQINFNLFILIVISFDIFSYIFGKLLGKNQLIKISPNKTVEGLLGGVFISFFLSLIFSYFFEIAINMNLIIYIVLIIGFAYIGDILESYFKRKNNLKNSSNLIPGHGGVFDRFDSLIFSIIIYSISINIIV